MSLRDIYCFVLWYKISVKISCDDHSLVTISRNFGLSQCTEQPKTGSSKIFACSGSTSKKSTHISMGLRN